MVGSQEKPPTLTVCVTVTARTLWGHKERPGELVFLQAASRCYPLTILSFYEQTLDLGK